MAKLAKTFCRCIKKVKRTVKVRNGSKPEQAAIGICVKSVLGTRGKTLQKFSCTKKGGPILKTQSLLKKGV